MRKDYYAINYAIFSGLIYIVLMLFNRQLECKGIMKHLF